MRQAEKLAASVLRAWLPNTAVTPITQQSHGEHDLELAYSDGRRGIVEVAAVVDGQSLSTIAAILHGRGGDVIPAVRSKGGWYINPTKKAPINRLRKEIDDCLAKLEAAGVSSFNAHMLDVPDEFIADLERLGVESGDDVDFVRHGTIHIGLPSDGGLVGTAAVNEAVLEAAQRPDNLRKLSSGTAEERHIFVFVESSAGAPYAALFLCRELPPAPCPPQPITHLWVAAYLSTLNDVVVWHSARSTGWTRRKLRIPFTETSEGPEPAV
jgi:hypothetical protein